MREDFLLADIVFAFSLFSLVPFMRFSYFYYWYFLLLFLLYLFAKNTRPPYYILYKSIEREPTTFCEVASASTAVAESSNIWVDDVHRCVTTICNGRSAGRRRSLYWHGALPFHLHLYLCLLILSIFFFPPQFSIPYIHFFIILSLLSPTSHSFQFSRMRMGEKEKKRETVGSTKIETFLDYAENYNEGDCCYVFEYISIERRRR